MKIRLFKYNPLTPFSKGEFKIVLVSKMGLNSYFPLEKGVRGLYQSFKKEQSLLKLFMLPLFCSLEKVNIGEYYSSKKTAKGGSVLLLFLTLIIGFGLISCNPKDSLGLDANVKEIKLGGDTNLVSPDKNKFIMPDTVIFSVYIGHGSIYNMVDTIQAKVSVIDLNIRIDASTTPSTLWFNSFKYTIYDDSVKNIYEAISKFQMKLDSVKCLDPISHGDNDKVSSLITINYITNPVDLTGSYTDFQLQFNEDIVTQKTHGRIHGRYKASIPSVYQPNKYIFFFGEIDLHYTYTP
jgi:hypothetical protein